MPLPSTPAHALPAHEGAIAAVRFNAAGTYALSCGKDRSLKLWNPHTGVAVKAYTGHGYDVRDVTVSSDNARLTSVGGDRTIFHWDVATGAIVRRWRGHDEGPPGASCVTTTPGDALILTGGPDTTARAWDLRSRSDVAVAVLRGARDAVTGVAVPAGVGTAAPAAPAHTPSVSRPTGAPPAASPTSSSSSTAHEIVTASVDGSLRRYDLRAGQLTADAVGSPIASLALSRADGGATALVACLDGRLRLLDRGTGALLASYTGHAASGGIRTDCVILPPGDASVAVGSEDGCVVGWDLASEALTDRVSTGAPGPVTSVAVHPLDGRTMVTGSTDGVVRVFKAGGGI